MKRAASDILSLFPSLMKKPFRFKEYESFLPFRIPDSFSLLSYPVTETFGTGIILHGLDGIDSMIHLVYGHITHGIFVILKVAAGEVDIFDVAHDW